MSIAKYTLATLLVLTFTAPAYAAIGEVGSPVKPSNTAVPSMPADEEQSADKDTAQPAKPAKEAVQVEPAKPLLVLRFNRQHVYFERALRQAIEATRKSKAGATFHVISAVPSAGSRASNSRMENEAADNLRTVLAAMAQMNVPSTQITSLTLNEPGLKQQEIRIYVR